MVVTGGGDGWGTARATQSRSGTGSRITAFGSELNQSPRPHHELFYFYSPISSTPSLHTPGNARTSNNCSYVPFLFYFILLSKRVYHTFVYITPSQNSGLPCQRQRPTRTSLLYRRQNLILLPENPPIWIRVATGESTGHVVVSMIGSWSSFYN